MAKVVRHPAWSLVVEVLDARGAPTSAQVELQAFDRRELDRPFVSGGVSLRNEAFTLLARGRARPGEPARFTGLPRSDYRVRAVGDDQACAVTTHHLAETAGEERVELQLAAPARVEGVVRVPRAAAGRFLVLALSEHGFVEGAVSDARGAFSIGGLDAGTYRVSATFLHRGTSARALELPAVYRRTRPQLEVRLASGERRPILLEGFTGTGSLAGSVRLNGGSIDTPGSGRTKVPDMPAGAWRLATCDAEPRTQDFEIRAGETTEVEFAVGE